ncbi:hypothetical protein ABW21_db0204987 [Orbilia brochopaga]|nr:hypothetical protein ABW21_db0204987 [Drechslerella brochopaga]
MNNFAQSAAIESEHMLQQRSLTQKTVKGFAVAGLTLALIAVVAIASLVTAATLSVLSFNKIYLRVIASKGTAKEKEYAQMVLKLRKRPYNMICAFVFTGSAMAELIPLLISLIMQEVSQGTVSGNLNAISIVVAVVLVIFFVELLPLGYTVRRALFVNKFLIRFSEILLIIWYPLTFPISYILEKLYEFDSKSCMTEDNTSKFANTEERFFSNPELTAFVELHIMSPDQDGGNVHKSVVDILKGAFRLQTLQVKHVMTNWADLKYLGALVRADEMFSKDLGMALYGNGLDGGLLIEVEDAHDYMRKFDPEMLPMEGMKVKGCISWTSFTANLGDGPGRAERLITDPMPIVYDCFEDIYTLLSILHHGICRMALVVMIPFGKHKEITADSPLASLYPISRTKVYWSNQAGIMGHVKPIGVISYQALLKVIFGQIGHSNQELVDPMEKYASHRMTSEEKREILKGMNLQYDDDRDPNWRKKMYEDKPEPTTTISSAMAERILNLGTRRRTRTVVNPRSPIRSARGSVSDVRDGDGGTKENEKGTL